LSGRADVQHENADEALEMLAHFDAECGGGLSNHGLMADQALVALGRAAAAVAWVERYHGRLEDAQRTGASPVEGGAESVQPATRTSSSRASASRPAARSGPVRE
jgi:hypothetical protein